MAAIACYREPPLQSAQNTARSERALSANRVSPTPTVSWRDCPRVTMKVGSAVSGLSISTLYRVAGEGRLTLWRLGGRVLIETSDLIALIDSAEPWSPSNRGKEARAKRAEIARSNWRD